MKVDFKELLKELSKPDGKEQYRAKVKLRGEVARAGAPGKEAERAELAAAMAKAVTSRRADMSRRIPQLPFSSTAMRNELLRYLCEIAGENEVTELMKVSDDLEVRDYVRRVIECIPGEKATQALTELAVKSEGTEFRIGAINALSKREGPASAEALKVCAMDGDPRIRLAAAEAMSKHADPGFDALIVSALDPSKGTADHCHCNCLRLRLAAQCAKVGKKEAAMKIYRSVANANPTASERKAADWGLQQLGGGK
jgi:hypothetical protein